MSRRAAPPTGPPTPVRKGTNILGSSFACLLISSWDVAALGHQRSAHWEAHRLLGCSGAAHLLEGS